MVNQWLNVNVLTAKWDLVFYHRLLYLSAHLLTQATPLPRQLGEAGKEIPGGITDAAALILA